MVTIRWFPPSWIQIKNTNSVLYVDPAYLKKYYSNHSTKIEYSTWPDEVDGLPDELPKADIILLTHRHKDHCKNVTVKRLCNQKTFIYGPKKCQKEITEDLTIGRQGEFFERNGFVVKTIASYNTIEGCAEKKVHKKGECIGYIITTEGVVLYHPGDSSFINEMVGLKNIRIDIAFIPIDGVFTMDIEEAMQASIAISPKKVIPIHDMGKNDPKEFKKKLEKCSQIIVDIPKIGEEITYD